MRVGTAGGVMLSIILRAASAVAASLPSAAFFNAGSAAGRSAQDHAEHFPG